MTGMRLILTAAAIAACTLTGAQAAGYPERPIQVIVPFPAGGATDASARLIVPYIERYLPNSNIVVINKTGGGGEIGLHVVLNGKPDGYTIGLFTVPNMLMKPHERKTDWTVDSFLPLAQFVYDPAVVATRAAAEFSNIKELIEASKKRTLTVGSAGIGSNDHLTILALQKATGVQFNHIPYTGSAPSRTAVLGGHVDFYVTTISDALTPIRNGQLKPLGIVTKERLDFAKEVPTFAEQGINFQGAGGSSARGFVVHKDTPKEIVNALAGAIEKAMKDPEFVEGAKKLGLPLVYRGPAEYSKYLHDSNADLADLWKNTPWLTEK
jgi:tripartite-type tricarboxylate transporter receptor subunit TctC